MQNVMKEQMKGKCHENPPKPDHLIIVICLLQVYH